MFASVFLFLQIVVTGGLDEVAESDISGISKSVVRIQRRGYDRRLQFRIHSKGFIASGKNRR